MVTTKIFPFLPFLKIIYSKFPVWKSASFCRKPKFPWILRAMNTAVQKNYLVVEAGKALR